MINGHKDSNGNFHPHKTSTKITKLKDGRVHESTTFGTSVEYANAMKLKKNKTDGQCPCGNHLPKNNEVAYEFCSKTCKGKYGK